ncbi:MAG TPA: transcription initiation factor IIB family protein [Nitrososphaerales archaeon]|nr:transcription initiation factor IIB family protein [Nitrososphaerales archaeon]
MKQAAAFSVGSLEAREKEGFNEAINDVKRLATVLHLNSGVVRRASGICGNAFSMRIGQDLPPQILSAAAVYVACREAQKPVTLKDLADASHSDPRAVGRCYVKLMERMHISRPELNENGYVYRLTLKRPISEQALKQSQEIIHSINSKGLGGRNPMTLAAAALYIACCNLGEIITQAEVAEAAGVGEQSVRDCCKEIRLLTKAA